MPEKILTALAIDRVAPGVLSGQEIISSRTSIEDMVLVLARTTGTSLDAVRQMPLWQIIRYVKKLAKQTPND